MVFLAIWASSASAQTPAADEAHPKPELVLQTGHSGAPAVVAFSPDGRYLASATAQEVKLWEPATGLEMRTLRRAKSTGLFLAFSKDGRSLFSAGPIGTVVYEVPERREIRTATRGRRGSAQPPAYPLAAAVSPDGRARPRWSHSDEELCRQPRCMFLDE